MNLLPFFEIISARNLTLADEMIKIAFSQENRTMHRGRVFGRNLRPIKENFIISLRAKKQIHL